MWGKIGQSQGDGQQQSGNLWSRFAQVVTDVAQDLAQPTDEDDDYEDGEGWDEGESLGLEGTQSCEQDDQYPDGEEEYQGEEGLYEYDEADVGENAWGHEEDVDFSMEEEPVQVGGPYYATEQPQQPLFGNEQHQEAANHHEWDLEDEDLFGETEAAQDDTYQEQPVGQETATPVDEDPGWVSEDFGQNDCGEDNNLNFDDSHVRLEPTTTDQQYVAEDQDGNDWDHDDVNLEESFDNNDNNTCPDSEVIAGQTSQDTFKTAEHQGLASEPNGWDYGPGFDDQEQNIDDNIASEAEIVVQESQETYRTAESHHEDADASGNPWDDELNFSDDHHNALQAVEPVVAVEDNAAQDADVEAVEDTWNPDVLNFSEHNDDDQVPALTEENAAGQDQDVHADGNAWDDDDLNFSDRHDDHEMQPPEAETALAPGVPSEQPAIIAQNADDANADDGDAWGDDLEFSEHQGEAAQTVSETMDAALTSELPTSDNDGGDGIVDDSWNQDDLNLSEDRHDAEQIQPNECDPTHLPATDETPQLFQDEEVAPGGGPWDHYDLDFSDRQDNKQLQPANAETSSPNAQTSRESQDLSAADGNGAWHRDDLTFSEHSVNDDVQQSTEGELTLSTNIHDAEQTQNEPEKQGDAGVDVWGQDVLEFSEHHDDAQQSFSKVHSSPIEIPDADQMHHEPHEPEHVDGGSWDHEDLEFSERHDESQQHPTEAALVHADAGQPLNEPLEHEDMGADAWDQDDLEFSENLDNALEQPPETGPSAPLHDEDQQQPTEADSALTNDFSNTNRSQTDSLYQKDAGTDGWEQDNLECSELRDDDLQHLSKAEPSTAVEVTDVDQSPKESLDDEETGGDAWEQDDLNFSEHHDQDHVPQQLVRGGPAAAAEDSVADGKPQDQDETGGGAWEQDDLNFLELHGHDDQGQLIEAKLAKTPKSKDANQAPYQSQYQEDAVGDAWDQDDLDFSDNNNGLKPEPAEDETLRVSHGSGGDVIHAGVAVDETSGAKDACAGDDKPWDHAELNLDDEAIDGLEDPDGANAGHDEDDDSTVEQSNTAGGDQSTEEQHETQEPNDEQQTTGAEGGKDDLRFVQLARNPSRRATVRVSNTTSGRADSEEGKDANDERIVGTSVMFADLTLSDHKSVDSEVHGESDNAKLEVVDTKYDGTDHVQSSGLVAGAGRVIQEERAVDFTDMARDNVSSVSDSIDGPKPLFETQISMMTLKSIADSCPSRHPGQDSDDDEDGYGPVVDKTPEVSMEPDPAPALSTMTVNSTAVAAHSVNEDIQQDDDMDGTYYGSTMGDPSAENVWAGDDASSLEGLDEIEEKIVNFELSTEVNNPSISQAQTPDTRLVNSEQEDVVDSTPRLNSSMANVYTDDNSCPSRDKDDDDEDVYKPVVDQIPQPLKLVSEKSGRTLSSLAVLVDHAKQDEDTEGIFTGGSATNRDSSADDGGDHIWDDAGSAEGNGLEEDEEGSRQNKEKVIATGQATSHVVVDNTPNEDGSTGKADGSLAAVESVDSSCPSRVHDSDEEVYGLVVDQIPASPPPLLDQMSVAASSMAVVANNVEEDLKEDEEMDASDHGESTMDELGASGWEHECPALEEFDSEDAVNVGKESAGPDQQLAVESTLPAEDGNGAAVPDGEVVNNDRVVDLTPKMEPRRVSRLSSNSLAVLAHSINLDFEDNDEDEEDDANFGPIVDITPAPQRPPPLTPSSTAVLAANIKEDIKDDDRTGGIGDITWEDESPELEDLEKTDKDVSCSDAHVEGEPQPLSLPGQQRQQNQVVLVDHTPEGETPRRKVLGDASLAVLAPSEDGTGMSMDDDDDDDITDLHPLGEHVSYGPVVDITPTTSMQPVAAPNTAPSVTFSLAVEACSVEEDIKRDEEMDETLCGDNTTIGGGNESGWEDDQVLDDLDTERSLRGQSDPSSFKLPPSSLKTGPTHEIMVDHTPQLSTLRPRPGDASLVVLAPSEASTYRTGEGDNENNDCDTITNEGDVYGKVVDHTPRLAPIPLVSSNSMAVGASSADYRSEMERDEDMDATTCFGDSADGIDGDGWEDDDKALEEVETEAKTTEQEAKEENVVDHTPTAEERPQRSANIDPSVVVLAPSDDGSCEPDDTDTQDGNHVFGPVVDITPEGPSRNPTMSSSMAVEAQSLEEDIRHDEEMDGTLFGDSTIGGEGGWDEDDPGLEDFLDDGKKAESQTAPDPSNTNLWPSAEAVSDNASSQLEGSAVGRSFQDAVSQDGVVLVDHTPSEIDSTNQKNSVAWLINVESGISGDNDTEDAGAGWAQDDPILEDAASTNQGAEEDQVVDRIPQRPESRFGDASTLVVADPSEVLSHVDDMLQEDNFGPVVDQTPPSRPSAPHALSAAGSTVVVAPTVIPEDLDDAESVNAPEEDEENGWGPDPAELEQTPNPQSGNEEETTRVREQVVDFLPPQEEAAVTDQNRDGWSEVATGGVPSVLQADPKEDEFGRKFSFPFAESRFHLSYFEFESDYCTFLLRVVQPWSTSSQHLILPHLFLRFQPLVKWNLPSVMLLQEKMKPRAHQSRVGIQIMLSWIHCQGHLKWACRIWTQQHLLHNRWQAKTRMMMGNMDQLSTTFLRHALRYHLHEEVRQSTL
jgi:hypothetical protein